MKQINKEEKESEKHFQLKQLIADLILIDLKKEWEAGFFPSTDTKTYQMTNKLCEMVSQSFVYLKERGEIYIMKNAERGTNIILGESWVKQLGIKGKFENSI